MCKPWSVIIAHLSRVTSVCKPWSVIIAHFSRVTSVCKPWSIVCYASVETCKQVMWLILLPGIDCLP